MPNQNSGPVQVLDNTAASINQALAQVLERIDDLRGLRGPITLHDRVTVGAPIDGGDAINLSTLLSDFINTGGQPASWRNLGAIGRQNEMQGEDPEIDLGDPAIWAVTDRAITPEDIELSPSEPFLWLLGASRSEGGTEPENAPPNVDTTSSIGTVVGRYAREDHTHGVSTDSFTITGTGFVANPTGTAYYAKVGPVVALFVPELTDTSNATTFTLTGLPAAITPTQTTYAAILQTDNGTDGLGFARFNASSTTVDLFVNPLAAWTAAGAKRLYPQFFIYALV